MTGPASNFNKNLADKKCIPCEGGDLPAMTLKEAQAMLAHIDPEWVLESGAKKISRVFKFKGFNKTMGFVNALAWIVNQESHHPELEVTYDSCTVHFQTHALNGLSENDFICAKKIDRLLLS